MAKKNLTVHEDRDEGGRFVLTCAGITIRFQAWEVSSVVEGLKEKAAQLRERGEDRTDIERLIDYINKRFGGNNH